LTTLLNTGNTRDGALPSSCPVQFSRCKQRKTTLQNRGLVPQS